MNFETAIERLYEEGCVIQRNQEMVEQFVNDEHLLDVGNTRITFDDICADDWEVISI
jgi:hypothetical protein